MDTDSIIQIMDSLTSVVVLIWIVNVGLTRLKDQQEENQSLNRELLAVFRAQSDAYMQVLKELCNARQ